MQVLVLSSVFGFSQKTVCPTGCDYSNNITSNLVWNDFHYQIFDDVTIAPGCTLTINACSNDILLDFDDGKSMFVNGKLNANGNADYTIRFTKMYSYWNGINITSSAGSSIFNYCIIENVNKSPNTFDFDGCGAVFIDNNNNTTFDNCIFRYNEVGHSGAAITFYESKADVVNCEFYENEAQKNGGAILIYNTSNTSEISGCTFEQNIAGEYGGAIWLEETEEVSIGNNSQFTENDALGTTDKGGGAIGIYNASALISSSTFSLNQSSYNGGSIYAKQDNSALSLNLEITSSPIFQNTADNNGGGIYIEGWESDLDISLNNIYLNEADNGAGIYIDEIQGMTNAEINGNQISSNTATYYGGGLYINGQGLKNMESNLFQQNEAINGGGVYLSETEVDVFKKNDFESNTASQNGGGLFLDHSYIEYKLGEINSNQAQNNGGGIYITGIHASQHINELINCLIAENLCGANGGALYCDEQIEIYSNTIANNNASDTGGGLYNPVTTSTIINTILWGNTATSYSQAFPEPNGNIGYSFCVVENIAIPNCVSCSVGDPEFVGNGDYSISYGTSCFNIGNNSTTRTLYDLDDKARIIHGLIDIGAYEARFMQLSGDVCNQEWEDHNEFGVDYVITGNIYIRQSCSLSITENTSVLFDGSYSLSVYGQLLANGDENELITFTSTPGNTWRGIKFMNVSNASEIDYCDISNVYKPGTGYCVPYDSSYSGAIYMENCSTYVSISNSKIHDNEICDCGGGIFITTSSPTINNNEIYDNTANRSGGGITIIDGAPLIELNFIEDNLCTYHGGGIYTESPDNPIILNNLIAKNYANINGGGIFMSEDSETEIYNCTVADNTANSGSGGGFYNDDYSVLESTNNIIWGNTAYYSSYNQIYDNCSSCSLYYSNACTDHTFNVSCTDCQANNPEFIGNGDYSIIYTSSCFEGGDNGVLDESENDLRGVNRRYNQNIDIGAYEVPTIIVDCSTNINNQTWVKNQYSGVVDYLISCDRTVGSGYNLEIQEGVVVAFEDQYRLNIEGELDAQGNENDYITFTASSTNTNGWLGINFGSSLQHYDGNSILRYCIITDIDKRGNSGTDPDNNSVSGAVFVYSDGTAEIIIDNCIIHDNKVPAYGGGIQCYNCTADIEIKNSQVYNNVAGLGGGGISIYDESTPAVHHNQIHENETDGDGGGIYVSGYCNPVIYHNYIMDNTIVNFGGGIFIGDHSNPLIYNNLLHHNYADNGGGIYIDGTSNPDVYSCTIADNEAYDLSGAGGVNVVGGSDFEFKNTIVFSNKLVDFLYDGTDPDGMNGPFDNCVISNFYRTARENMTDDPEFVGSRDYRISRIDDSPCFEAGDRFEYDDFLHLLSEDDIQGNPRITDCYLDYEQIDIGAYEYEISGDCDNPTNQGTYKFVKNDSLLADNNSHDFVLYPNPAEHWFALMLYSDKEELATLKLLNTIGQIEMEKEINLIKGENYFIIQSDQITRGLYLLKVESFSIKNQIMKIILK